MFSFLLLIYNENKTTENSLHVSLNISNTGSKVTTIFFPLFIVDLHRKIKKYETINMNA